MKGVQSVAERVGVVVVHYGDPSPTMACLKALRSDESVPARQVVVVDNSAALAEGCLQRETLLRCPDNPGFGAGANRGVEALGQGPWSAIVILNNDVEVAQGFLAAATGALVDGRVGAAVGPLFLDRPGGRVWYAGGGVNFLSGTVRQSISPHDASRKRRVGFFPGAAFAVSERAWRELGGFDPAYFLYNEDLDFCLRLRRRGYTLMFEPAMAAVHRLGSATGSGRRSPLYLELTAANRLRPFRPLAYRLYLALLHTGYVALRAGWYCLGGRGRQGREGARALVRGHLRALSRIGLGPAA